MSQRTKNILGFCISGMIVFLAVAPALTHAITIEIPNPLKSTTNSIPDLIAAIIDNIVLPVGGVIAALMIIYAGFLFVTARGDTKKITDARQAILYACIGAAILLGAKIIASAIQATVNQLT
jgi:hypothetical protein